MPSCACVMPSAPGPAFQDHWKASEDFREEFLRKCSHREAEACAFCELASNSGFLAFFQGTSYQDIYNLTGDEAATLRGFWSLLKWKPASTRCLASGSQIQQLAASFLDDEKLRIWAITTRLPLSCLHLLRVAPGGELPFPSLGKAKIMDWECALGMYIFSIFQGGFLSSWSNEWFLSNFSAPNCANESPSGKILRFRISWINHFIFRRYTSSSFWLSFFHRNNYPTKKVYTVNVTELILNAVALGVLATKKDPVWLVLLMVQQSC